MIKEFSAEHFFGSVKKTIPHMCVWVCECVVLVCARILQIYHKATRLPATASAPGRALV